MTRSGTSGTQHPALRRWLIFAAGLVIGVLALYGIQRFAHRVYDQPAAQQLDQSLAETARLKEESSELRSARDRAQGELTVQRSAQEELVKRLRDAEAETGRVRDQVAFYEQLLPPGPEGAISIRAFEASRVPEGLSYRVLLIRSGRPGEKGFNGSLRFSAAGRQDGASATHELTVSSDGSGAGPTPPIVLQFDQYQRSLGFLALPKGFFPETLTVNVLEGSTVRASLTLELEL